MEISENKFQWFAIGMTAVGLVVSAYFGAQSLRAVRLQSELSTYLQLNDNYNRLLFTLIQNDPKVFQKSDDSLLVENKYIIYEMFELFSTIQCLETYCTELGADIWPIWQKRLEFLCSKPAFEKSWNDRLLYAESIYKPDFITRVNRTIDEAASKTTKSKRNTG